MKLYRFDAYAPGVRVDDPNTPAAQMPDARQLTDDAQFKLSMHPNTPPDTLHALKDHPDESVRGHVAAHPNTAIEDLVSMEHDRSHYVRVCLGANPRLPREIRRRIIVDETGMSEALAEAYCG